MNRLIDQNFQIQLPSVEAVLVDRDGVVNENRSDHVKNWAEFKFLPEAKPSLQRLRSAGLKLGLVTNQAIVERGIVDRSLVESIHDKMQQALALESAQFHSIQYCPHRPESNCDCRKPKPGLAIAAINELQADPSKTCIVGDTYGDAISGLTAGCTYAILIPSTRDPGDYNELPLEYRERVVSLPSFEEATSSILKSMEKS